jgi:hypothetical protein
MKIASTPPMRARGRFTSTSRDTRSEPCDRARGGALGLELPAVAHGASVAGDDWSHELLDLGGEVAEVRSLVDVERDDGLALRVLTRDQVRRELRADVGHLCQSHVGAAGTAQDEVLHVLHVIPAGRVEAHADVHALQALVHLGRLHAEERVAHLSTGIERRQAMSGEVFGPIVDGQRLDHQLAVRGDVPSARKGLERRLDLPRDQSERRQVVPVDADRDGCRGAGEDVAQTVLYGLTHVARDPRNLGQDGGDFTTDLLHGVPGLQGHVDLGGADRLGVLVALGTARPTRDALDARDALQPLLYRGGDPVAGPEGCAWRGEEPDHEGPFVELRKEGGPEGAREPEGEARGDGRSAE